MNTTTRLLKVTAALCLGVLLPGLLNAAVVKQSFSYDAAGRLTGVSVADRTDAGERYRYDASGNIVEKTVNGQTVTMTYDAANQLMTRTDAAGTTRFVYDSAGRLVEEQRGGETLASYEYGYLDKVTSVTRDGVVTKFHYNARGMLVAKERDGTIIETLGWDGIGLIARDDTVFANEAHISGGVPLVAATTDGSVTSYFDSDYLGTTTASYSADGDVNAYVQGSFGQGTEIADARFTGKHYDADLGAHVFPFRNYRSDTGRWTSADPAGFPDGPNQHFYAPVPTMGLDPLGLWRSGIPYGSLFPYHTDITDRIAAAGAPTVFGGFGFDLSKRAVEHLIAGTTATIPDIVLNAAEQAAFIADTAFQDVRDFVQSHVELQGGNHTSFGPPLAGVGIRFGGWTDLALAIQNVTVHLAGSITPVLRAGWTDLALAIQNVTVHLAGSITPVLRAGTVDIYDYSGDLTVSFIDPYDFRIGSNPLVNVFARLETHLWSSAFNITGNWSVNFSGEF